MDDETKLPRFSYDLITFLDEHVARPGFPNTAKGFGQLDDSAVRQAAFTSGARSVVDWLLAWRQEEIDRDREDEDASPRDVPDGAVLRFPRLLGPDGEVREITPSIRVDE